MAGAVLFLLKRNLLPESGLEIENACQGQSVRRSEDQQLIWAADRDVCGQQPVCTPGRNVAWCSSK